MQRIEIESGIKALAPWFHRIDLGDGLLTKRESVSGEPADHPLGTWKFVAPCLPLDLSGKSVIDVGCNAGFYALQAKQRNAARVLGVDVQRHHVQQAIFVRNALHLDIEYRQASVYNLNPGSVGRFDVVLALGLIYHIKHVVLALERLFDIADDLLILETAVLPASAFRDAPLDTDIGGKGLLHHPMAFVENRSEAKEAVYNWFIPGPHAMAAMLKSVGFTAVKIEAEHSGRAVFTARRPAKVLPDIHRDLKGQVTLLQGGRPQAVKGERLEFQFRVQNTGSLPWSALGEGASGKGAIKLGAHLLARDEIRDWDYARCDLPCDVAPGEAVQMACQLPAPETSGDYMLEFELVSEHMTWFGELGCELIRQALTVVDPE
jgi:tRNA (mo5U34)-methyltransferase